MGEVGYEARERHPNWEGVRSSSLTPCSPANSSSNSVRPDSDALVVACAVGMTTNPLSWALASLLVSDPSGARTGRLSQEGGARIGGLKL